MAGRLFDKIWDRHLVASPEGEPPLLYIDLHLVHEVTSPQAFEGIELAGRKVRRPDLTVATMDHDVPTIGLDRPIADPLAAEQIARLRPERARSTASRCTRSAASSRASCTSSARSSASPSRA